MEINLESIESNQLVSENLARSGRNFNKIQNEFAGFDPAIIKERNTILWDEMNTPDYTPVLRRQEPVFSVGTGYDSNNVLQDLKSSIIKGQVPINAKGLSAVNLLGNKGDCENTADFLVGYGTPTLSLDTANKVFGTNALKVVTTNSGDGTGIKFKVRAGKYYLLSGYFKLDAGTMAHSLYDVTNAAYIGASYPITSATIARTARKVSILTDSADIRFLWKQSGATAMTLYTDGIMVNEITADEYNNLTVDQLMTKYPYINGLQGVNNVSVKSVGKNLWLKNELKYGVNASAGYGEVTAVWNSDDTITLKMYSAISTRLFLNAGTYTISFKSDITITDGHIAVSLNTVGVMAFSNIIANTRTSLSITIPSTGYYDLGIAGGAAIATSVTLLDIQLERNDVTTSYEPYAESVSEIPVVLHSLPNGVKDEIVDGKLIKSIAEYVLKASDTTVFITTTVNLDYAEVTIPITNQSPWIVGINNKIIFGAMTEHNANYGNDDVAYIGKYAVIGTNSIRVYFAKGTYANLAAAQTALAGTKLIYQLATPIVEDLVTPLTVFPNGTISVESDLETTMPELNLKYPLDVASVIARLNDAVNQVSKIKADALPPTELEIPFINSLVKTAEYRCLYCKNDFNEVTISARYQKSGSSDDIPNGTQLCTLPVGYRPKEKKVFNAKVVSASGSNGEMHADCVIDVYGVVKVFLPIAVSYKIGQFSCTFVGGN